MNSNLHSFTVEHPDGTSVTYLGHATDNVMVDYVNRYLPYLKPGDKIVIERVEPTCLACGHEAPATGSWKHECDPASDTRQ